MMNKSFILLFFSIVFSFKSNAQQLVDVKSYPVPKDIIWMVDGMENIIISEKDRLTKYSKDGKLLFNQSQKSVGRLNEIGMFNSLKIFGFSESQQLICFYDNSLSIMEKCIDLSDYNLINVSAVASSGQSDKLWVFDQVNSTLHLLSFNGLFQSQQIKNLGGILDSKNSIQLLEWENKLLLLDSEKGIYVFDIYGTLIRFIDIPNVKHIQYYNNYIICLIDQELKMISMDDNRNTSFPLPYEEVLNFHVDDNFIYFNAVNNNDYRIIKSKFIFE